MLSSAPLLRARRIEPEILDDTPPEQAARSLRDLVRINRYFGGHEALRMRLAELFEPGESFTLLDVGAASGDMGDAVRRRFAKASVTSLDYRVHHLQAACGLRVVGDAFRLPFRRAAYDVVHCSLFLHHFRFRQVLDLFRGFGEVARRYVVVTDLERHPIPWLTLPATRWLFGWDPITLHDGPISVAAGFRAHELEHLARLAGLRDIRVTRHRRAFRISVAARPPE